MSNVAYTPKDAPATVAKPGRVLICRNGECKLSLKFGVYFDGTGNNQELGDRAEDGYSRTDMARRSRWFATAGVALFALALVACAPKQPDPDATFGSSVTAMDHDPSDTFVRNVFVDGTWVGEGGAWRQNRAWRYLAALSLAARVDRRGEVGALRPVRSKSSRPG